MAFLLNERSQVNNNLHAVLSRRQSDRVELPAPGVTPLASQERFGHATEE